MNSIKVLDVTLRDGGCVNDFNFGQVYMEQILAAQEASGVEMIEMGYLDENKGSLMGRTQWKTSEAIYETLMKIKKPGVTYLAIMDYGKFRFEQTKKEKEAKKNQHIIDIKEIRMGPSIGENDFNTKLKNGMKFLTDGDRLKVSVRFRGREMAHTEIGEVLLKDFAEKCAEIATLDKAPKLEGRNMTIFLSPKPVTPPKKPAKPKQPKQQEAEAPATEKAE